MSPSVSGRPREVAADGVAAVRDVQPVTLDVQGKVATLRFANPEQRGALTPEILVGLREGLARAEAARVRVVVLRGTGGVFSSGFAIDRIPDAGALEVKDAIELLCEAVEESPVVVIALLEGYVIGAGLDVACACDFRFASSACQIGITPSRLGLVYTWRGVRRIERLVGRDATRWLFFTGDLVGGDEARRMGIARASYERTEDLEREVYEFAQRLSANAPRSLAGTKQILMELDRASDVHCDAERRLHALRVAAMQSADAREAKQAFAERRPPVFTGLT